MVAPVLPLVTPVLVHGSEEGLPSKSDKDIGNILGVGQMMVASNEESITSCGCHCWLGVGLSGSSQETSSAAYWIASRQLDWHD